MPNSAEISMIQKLAGHCLQYLLDPTHELDLDTAELGSIPELDGAGLSASDLASFGRKLRATVRFREGKHAVAKRWSRRWASGLPPDEKQAREFLSDFFSLVDHSIFFDQGITASITHYRRGAPTGSDLDFPGGMPCWTLHLTLAGEALFLNDEMELAVKRGHLMLFRPESRYHYGLAPGALEWKHLWVLFQPLSHWSEWLEWETGTEGIFHMTLPDEHNTGEMESLFRSLMALKENPLPYLAEREHNRLEEILIHARGFQHTATKQAVDNRVTKACTYMENRLTVPFSVDEVASACNLSSSRFAHLFKQQMGIGPKAWSNNLRLQQARKMLLAGDDSVAVIASRVGFEDPTQFTRNFRKNVGYSPREFRQSFRSGSPLIRKR